MVDTFSRQNDRKRQRQHVQREANHKQGSADVFRCETPQEKVKSAFFDSVKKQAGLVYVFNVSKNENKQ